MRSALVLIVAAALLPAGAARAATAHDDASDPAYDDGFQDGDDGGSGFGTGWTFTTNNDPGGLTKFGLGSSTVNGDGDSNGDGDIDTGGRAWRLAAHGVAQAELYRSFSGPLAVGDAFSFDLDTEAIPPPFGFSSFELLTGANIAFDFRRSGNDPDYEYSDGDQFFLDTGIPADDEGVHVALAPTSSTTYRLRVTALATGVTAVIDGAFFTAGMPDWFRFGVQADDTTTSRILFVNAVTVPEPSARDEQLLAAPALLAVALRRRRG